MDKEETVEELKTMDEGYVYDVNYIQASSIKELNTKVRKALEKDYEPEGVPFLDTTTTPPSWTQMMIQMAYDDAENEESEE